MTAGKNKSNRNPRSPSPQIAKRTKGNQIPKVSSVDIFVPTCENFKVLVDDSGGPYTAMLNQTNLAQNNNKFFLIQALESIKHPNQFATWFRWGRVGYTGQTNLQLCSSVEEAVNIFTQKFFDKTLNEWIPKIHSKFKSVSGKYTLLPVESLTESSEDNAGKPMEKATVKYEETKLDKSVYELIQLISSRETFERELTIAGIDLTRMPLGRISAKMIKDGYAILRKLESQLCSGKVSRNDLIDLSNKFYTLIPHNFGFSKGVHYIIDSLSILKEKIDLLETLSQIRESNDEMDRIVEMHKKEIVRANPVDEKYGLLGYEVSSLDSKCDEFDMIRLYKERTQGPTHGTRTVIRNVYKLGRKMGNKTGTKNLKNKQLLWHGSRLTNWHSILSHGLKIAPPEAPHTGFMFDKGIYTADCYSKSAQYCYGSIGQRGLIVLCEVSLGNPMEALVADYEASKKVGSKASGFQSTKGVGRYRPNEAQFKTMSDGVVVPMGELIDTQTTEKAEPVTFQNRGARTSSRLASFAPVMGANGSLLYNEYVVYDINQVEMKYLVEIEFVSS